METQHFLFKSYPQHKFCNIIKSKWLILDNDHCQLNSELWLHWCLHVLCNHVSLHCEITRETCDRNSGSFSKVRISARISCSFHPSSETLWKLLWNSTSRRRRRRRDSRRPARWPLLAGHYQRTITGPRIWIAKRKLSFPTMHFMTGCAQKS